MRVFTELEKTLLKRIDDGQGRNLYNLIDPWIIGVSFEVNTTTNAVTIIFENDETEQSVRLPAKLQDIQSILIQSVNLIKLFEDKGYIFTYKNSQNIPNPFIFGQAAINLPSISYRFPDTRISELFSKYATQEIFVTPELKKFIADDFITREELRANRQYKLTFKALLVAILGLFLNFGFNVYNVFSKKSDNNEPLIQHEDLRPADRKIDTSRRDSASKKK